MKTNWQQTLEQLGYTLNNKKQIWCRPDYQGITYNDGDEIETRIANAVAGVQNISVLSPELREHCTDWASLYHLASDRANLMRPFEHLFLPDSSVLEVGAGCGAITRYMGECGANVLALEGTPRRAAIARSRTRNLANVTVLAERFNDFSPPTDVQFDVITLIGVLEYANLFTPSINPHLSMLQRVRQLLKPEGVLIIAIENQLGLKYFAGALEDHLGQPMYGIEGRYQVNQPQTFGLGVMRALLQDAGFVQSQFMSPLPDYKLPTSIVTESGFASPQFDSSALAWQSAHKDPQLPALTNFSLELAWPEIEKNGLGLELANSFLIAAKPELGKRTVDHSILAFHYSTSRQPKFCKQTRFVNQNDNIVLEVSRMVAPHTGTVEGSLMNQHIETEQTYKSGELLSQRFVKLVTQDGWTLAQLQGYLQTWFGVVQKKAKSLGADFNLAEATINTLLPGECIDCVAQNIIMRDGYEPEFIDNEWISVQSVKLGHLVFRQGVMLLNSVSRFGICANQFPMTRQDLMMHFYQLLSLEVTDQTLSVHSLQEAIVQQSVTGVGHERYIDWQSQNSINFRQVHYQAAEVLARQDELKKLLDNYERELVAGKIRHDWIIKQDSLINSLNYDKECLQNELQQIKVEHDKVLKSLSWRITKPVRFFGRIIRFEFDVAFSFAGRYISIALIKTRLLLAVKAYRYLARGDVAGLMERVRYYRKDKVSKNVQKRLANNSPMNVCVVTPGHTNFVAELIAERFHFHGWNATVTNEMPAEFGDDFYVVLCPQIFNSLPPGEKRIVYQLEQSVSSRWFDKKYFEILENSLGVLDYSLVNIDYLSTKGIAYPHVTYLPIGAMRSYGEGVLPSEAAAEVLFYGDSSSSPRRQKMLAVLREYFDVDVVNNLFGEEMISRLKSAKIIINLHYYENALLEMPRIQECLSLGIPVVSESSQDQNEYPELDRAVIFFAEGSVEDMISAVRLAIDKNDFDIQKSVAHSSQKFEFMFDRFMVSMGLLPSSYVSQMSLPLSKDHSMVGLSMPETIGRRKLFLDVKPNECVVFDGIRRKPGWVGCGLSYAALARHAKANNMKMLTVMEDDVILPNDFESKLDSVYRFLAAKEGVWDVFSGVIALLNPDVEVLAVEEFEGQRFVTINKMISMVFNIYAYSVMDVFSRWDPQDLDDRSNTIDKFLENQQSIRVVTTLPFLVGHREDVRSTLWGFQNSTYVEMIANSQTLLEAKVAAFLDRRIQGRSATTTNPVRGG